MAFELRGYVCDASGEKMTGVTVTAYEIDPDTWAKTATSYNAITDSNGWWQFAASDGLSEDKYYEIHAISGTIHRVIDGAAEVQWRKADLGSLVVQGASTLVGNVTASGTLTVTGAATLSDDLNVAGDIGLGDYAAAVATKIVGTHRSDGSFAEGGSSIQFPSYLEGGTAGHYSAGIDFKTNQYGVGNATPMSIRANHVLIGTTTDDGVNALQVDGTISATGLPNIVARQGGDATDWSTWGTDNYTSALGNIRIQCGAAVASVAAPIPIVFPVPFSAKPIVYVGLVDNLSERYAIGYDYDTISATQFTPIATGSIAVMFTWIAIGPVA